MSDAVPPEAVPPKEAREKRAKSSSGRHKEDKHRDGAREHKESRGEHHHKEPRESRERRDGEQREVQREDSSRAHRDKSRRDVESWLDVDLTQDGARPEAPPAAAPREKIPKRPSSRADSRPKGHNSAQPAPPPGDQPRPPPEANPAPPPGASSHKPRASSRHGSSRSAEKAAHAEAKSQAAAPPGDAAAPRPKAAEGVVPSAPQAPKESRRPKPARQENPPPEVADEDIQADPSPHKKQVKAAPAARNGHAQPQSNIPQVDDEHIEVHAHRPVKQHEPVMDEEEIPEEYENDFEDEDDGEEYKAKTKPVIPAHQAEPPPDARPKNAMVSIPGRPQSRGQMDGPKISARSPSPSISTDPTTVASIQEAMNRDKARAQKAQSSSSSAKPAAEQGRGFLANYEPSMPKFNLAQTTATERVALKRLQDLRERNILAKRSVEKIELFSQRPQNSHSLFLAGKSLKYANVKSISCQTGEDDQETGVQTEDTWTEDKEEQFPVLTMGKTTNNSKAGGEPSQLLPFLRRTLPLFEAAITESSTRRSQAYNWGGPEGGNSTSASCSARCELPKSFRDRFIGADVSISDVSLCPNWYGADHAVVLNTWSWREREMPSPDEALATFMRPVQSLIGLYALDGTSLTQGMVLRPARCLYSFCRLTSVAVVTGRPHLIVAGAETGSLLVWDLRTKPHTPGIPNAQGVGQAQGADDDISYFEGALWLRSSFSTDAFTFSSVQRGERDDTLDGLQGPTDAWMPSDGEGLHTMEVCCVRCSEGVEGDCMIFSLDSSGTVNFWRVLEIASSGNTTVKLAPQGSLSVADPLCNLSHFADSSYLCIHPQQQMQFVVVSASGLIQTHRQSSSSIADGPKRLELSSGRSAKRFAPEAIQGEEIPLCGLTGFDAQPCAAAFNPFLPGLLLAAYADGDLALYDSVLCVPVVHWSSVVPSAPTEAVSVSWSPLRPCVFFVKSANTLDVWDLSEQMHAPCTSIDLREHTRQAGGMAASVGLNSCCEMYSSARGQLVVALDGIALVLRLPEIYLAPRQSAPHQHVKSSNGMLKDLRTVDDLIAAGSEQAAVFPTLSKHARQLSVPPQCQLELEVLKRVLASAHPMQAWT